MRSIVMASRANIRRYIIFREATGTWQGLWATGSCWILTVLVLSFASHVRYLISNCFPLLPLTGARIG